jgi:hypothetical protein
MNCVIVLVYSTIRTCHIFPVHVVLILLELTQDSSAAHDVLDWVVAAVVENVAECLCGI